MNRKLILKIDTLFFLIRRNGCKELALDAIKKLIINKTELASLTSIFKKLIEIYQKAQEERFYFSFSSSYKLGSY